MQQRNPLFRLILPGLALALALPMAAQAHRAWILPAATTLSSEAPWVTFDAAVSNDIFHADYVPLRIDNLRVTTPSGKTTAAANVAVGQHRTTFDLQLAERGTYKLATANRGLFARWVKDGKPQRWRGSIDDYRTAIPAGAEALQLTETHRRIETFVTAAAPTETVFAPTGEGLELVPVTHPNDLFVEETADFRLLIDGQPAVGVEVEVIPGGMRYRDQQDALTATTDDKGHVQITWPAPGMYWLSAELTDDKASIKDAQRRASYTATLEVLPQ